MRFSFALFLLVTLQASTSWGQSLGVHGNTYPIQEENGADYLKRRMSEFKADGTVIKKQTEARAWVQNKIYNPDPISGISKTTKANTFWFDPSITTDKPIVDASGRILFPAGTQVNPLRYGGLSSRYIFIDARDEAQVSFAKARQRTTRDKIVLVGGSWVKLSRQSGFQVYYDQQGYLTKHFHIRHVPAVLEQDGLKLKIEEFLL